MNSSQPVWRLVILKQFLINHEHAESLFVHGLHLQLMDSEPGLQQSNQKGRELAKQRKWRRAWKAAAQELMPAGLVQLICMLTTSPETTLCGADTAAPTVSLLPLASLPPASIFPSPHLSVTTKEKIPPCTQNEARKFGTSGSFMVSPWLESNCQKGPLGPRHTKWL